MKKIKLSMGQEALVDDEDFNFLNQWRWHAQKQKEVFYAVRNVENKTIGRKSFRMHRVLMNVSDPNIFVDHINGNPLDNQKHNLRIATARQNIFNSKSKKNTTSKYKGINWDSIRKKWKVGIRINGKQTHIGYFKEESDAATAYDAMAKKVQGSFQRQNIKS